MNLKVIIASLVVAMQIITSCYAGASDSINYEETNTGDIIGTAVDCQGDPIIDATVYLNDMPDSILMSYLEADGTSESPYTAWPMQVYEDQKIDSVKTDSAGHFVFQNIETGYYQLYCYAPNEVPAINPNYLHIGGCGMVPLDYVRVAADSISILSLPMIRAWDDIGFQRIWRGEIKSKQGVKNDKKIR